MDCFAVSIVCGLVMKRFQFWPMLRIALMFGLFQAAMPCIGWLLGTQFYDYICRFDHWIAFGILGFLGGKMIWDDLKPASADNEASVDPYRWRVVTTLAVATSIDALAVGLSFSLLDIDLWYSVSIIGLTSFVLPWIGMVLAMVFGRRLRLKANLAGGLILVAIGVKILLEHLLQ